MAEAAGARALLERRLLARQPKTKLQKIKKRPNLDEEENHQKTDRDKRPKKFKKKGFCLGFNGIKWESFYEFSVVLFEIWVS